MAYRTRSGTRAARRPRTPARARTMRSVLVAIDGTAESDHVLELARMLEADGHTNIEIVSVCEPGPDTVAWPGLVSMPMLTEPGVYERARERAIRSQIARIRGPEPEWPVSVVCGAIGSAIAERAAELSADLILTGRGRHSLGERLMGEEHLLKLVRSVTVPVLAAAPSLRGRPSRVVIGIDFGPSTEHVLSTAGGWVADDARVLIAHVKPRAPLGIEDPAGWQRMYDESVRSTLDTMQRDARFPSGVVFEARLLESHPGAALTELASAEHCDCLVVGAQGSGFVHRLVVGSVATHVLRHAECSAMLVPAGA